MRGVSELYQIFKPLLECLMEMCSVCTRIIKNSISHRSNNKRVYGDVLLYWAYADSLGQTLNFLQRRGAYLWKSGLVLPLSIIAWMEKLSLGLVVWVCVGIGNIGGLISWLTWRVLVCYNGDKNRLQNMEISQYVTLVSSLRINV